MRRNSGGRARRGAVAAISGLLAEERVEAQYEAQGYQVLARRWRGKAGEIDLVCEHGGALIFVEVKSAPSHAQAAERLLRRQMDRICMAACEFCGDRPAGLLSEMRFDAALVDGLGRVQVIENAFGG
ncbi:YraN family protein [Paracoccus methylarcula]|uniref:YraN family protein n=1 Tax=Paracoccus methylarcula TaxID=72022 RepID=UPI001FEB9A9B|nr:YraN family protein [Paracoccus methylarcula]